MEWFIYLLKVSACTALFYLLYHFLLSKFTFFNLNRWYLIATLLLSFIIPTLTIEIEREVYNQTSVLQYNEIGIAEGTVNELDPEVNFIDTNATNNFQFDDYLIGFYLLVTTVLFLKLLTGIIKIVLAAKRNRTKAKSNYVIVPTDHQFKNSSFYKYLFIDESLSQAEKEQVINHEQVHIQKLHFVDKLLANLSVCVLWFNPFTYAYLNAIDANHEFEADANSTLDNDKSAYANLILNLSQNSNQLIINHFSKLPLKKRINMLFKNPTIPMKKLIYLTLMPLIIICCYAFVNQKEVLTFKTKALNNQKESLNKNQSLEADSYLGKTITGEIVELKTNKFPYNILLKTNNSTLSVSLSPQVLNKIKLGDKISIEVSGYLINVKSYDEKNNLTTELDGPIYTPKTVLNEKGQIIWFRARQPFHYEVNQVRFASSRISKIERSDDEIQRIVLFDGEFKIDLDIAGLKLKSDNFKIGDSVLARFIGEKLTKEKYYSTSNMVSLINKSNNSSLINNNLYSKFYAEDGKQIQKSSVTNSNPVLKDKQKFDVDLISLNGIFYNNVDGRTLVIDAGHGGIDNASKSITGLREKDMNLRVALILKEEALKRNIKVVLTRDNDKFLSLADRVTYQKGADAFISIHHNAMLSNKKGLPVSDKGFRGVEVYYTKNSKVEKSELFGLTILKSLKLLKDYPVRDSLKSQGLFVTREAVIPSIVIEMGNMSYKDSFEFINEEKNIRRICNLILDGYGSFLGS